MIAIWWQDDNSMMAIGDMMAIWWQYDGNMRAICSISRNLVPISLWSLCVAGVGVNHMQTSSIFWIARHWGISVENEVSRRGKIQSKWCNIDCYKFRLFNFINATWHDHGHGHGHGYCHSGWKVSWTLFLRRLESFKAAIIFPCYLGNFQIAWAVSRCPVKFPKLNMSRSWAANYWTLNNSRRQIIRYRHESHLFDQS